MLVMEKIINKKYLDEFGLIERGYYLNKPQCSDGLNVCYSNECMDLRSVSVAIHLGMLNPLLIIIEYLQRVLNQDFSCFYGIIVGVH